MYLQKNHRMIDCRTYKKSCKQLGGQYDKQLAKRALAVVCQTRSCSCKTTTKETRKCGPIGRKLLLFAISLLLCNCRFSLLILSLSQLCACVCVCVCMKFTFQCQQLKPTIPHSPYTTLHDLDNCQLQVGFVVGPRI